MEDIVSKIISSKNYKDVLPALVSRVVDEESLKYKKSKDIEKSARQRLHVLSAVFFDDFENSFNALKKGEVGQDSKQFFLQVLSRHISVKERFNFYEEFFKDIFQVIDAKSICDVGCGFNPLAFFMFATHPIESYLALDVNQKGIEFLNLFFKNLNVPAVAVCQDILQQIPKQQFDVAFLFKLLPLLEQQKKGFSAKLLGTLNCKYFVVTYPTKTLSNRQVGMRDKYKTDLQNLALQCQLNIVFEKEYPNEIMFILKK